MLIFKGVGGGGGGGSSPSSSPLYESLNKQQTPKLPPPKEWRVLEEFDMLQHTLNTNMVLSINVLYNGTFK